MCQFGAAGMLYPPQNEHQPPLCVCRSHHEHTGAVASAAIIIIFSKLIFIVLTPDHPPGPSAFPSPLPQHVIVFFRDGRTNQPFSAVMLCSIGTRYEKMDTNDQSDISFVRNEKRLIPFAPAPCSPSGPAAEDDRVVTFALMRWCQSRTKLPHKDDCSTGSFFLRWFAGMVQRFTHHRYVIGPISSGCVVREPW